MGSRAVDRAGALLGGLRRPGGGLRGHPATTRELGPAPPPQVPEGAAGAEVAAQIQLVRPTTEFHAKATDRQAFQVHIDFGRVFESQGNFDGAVLEYQEALTVVETEDAGRFSRPTRRWLTGAWRARSIAWDDSPRPRCITRRPSSSAPKTRRSGTTSATAITSRADGLIPRKPSERPPSSRPTTSAFESTWA